MKNGPTLDQVRRHLSSLKEHEVVLFGSWCGGVFTPRSDIDVAVLSRKRDREENKQFWLSLLGKVPDRYDVRVFELMPLKIQADIVHNHVVVFGDPVEISAYFYPVRRRWNDVAPRFRENQPLPVRERVRRLRRANSMKRGAE